MPPTSVTLDTIVFDTITRVGERRRAGATWDRHRWLFVRMIAVPVLLCAVTLAASALPLRRATKVSPIITLRGQ
jgi:hypothetical protein